MKLILLFAMLMLVQNYWTPQFDDGSQVIVTYSSGHILESQSSVPRQVVINVQFSIVFQLTPQIFIQPLRVDWVRDFPGGFAGGVTSITTTGFKISGIALSPNPVYELHFYWIATTDPRILVITFATWDVDILKSGSGEREVQFIIEHDLEDATNGLISLIGIKHLAYNSIIEIDIAEITSKYITVSARTYSQSYLDYIKFNVLLGTAESLWSSPMQALINPPNHPFVSRGNGECDLNISIDRPQILGNYQLIPVIAIRGYDYNNAENIRLKFRNVVLNTQIQYILSTWSTSIVYRVYYQGAIFIYDPNFKIFDPFCAEIFSECDYNGDTIIICQKTPDLQALGWSQPIRSISVPKNRKLHLFNNVNFKGVKQSLIQTQQCIEFQNISSLKFDSAVSQIKVLYLNTIAADNCITITFYSQCNYQGEIFQIIKGKHLQLSNKIPFEIKSIRTCPNVIIKLQAPNYVQGSIKEITTSQSCMNSYKFPKYIASN
ncbi:unnamed protein product [Paramecium octaurelia]|uniref:H-type lectin domain-containing protein n=1 Tax=Paramecium octaurelia TaxID=43137 RepID=A0A8S1V2W1_PAROT|nr:unnamed protein product [Paramecium octaurelia]